MKEYTGVALGKQEQSTQDIFASECDWHSTAESIRKKVKILWKLR